MASGTPGVDYPEAREAIDVQAASRGDTLMSFVQESSEGSLLVTVAVDRTGKRVLLEVGEYLQLVWKGPDELRALPAELAEVVRGDEPLWRLKPLGPAARGQRRNAVRAPIVLPVEAGVGSTRLVGETIDVSEGGVHALFQPSKPGGAAPTAADLAVGSVLETTVDLGTGQEPIRSQAEVVRLHPRSDRGLELSLRFLGLPESEQDRVRARVFTELRVLRSRGIL